MPIGTSARFLLTTTLLLGAGLAIFHAPALADRKYFTRVYTPYLAPAGTLELETWLTSKAGKEDPTEHVTWEQRIEFEYGLTERLTTAAYLNYSQPSGEALHFDAPSIELIYRLADHGRIPGDPALYLETKETGEELELEPKILLGHRVDKLVLALNLVGELEYRHNDEELLPGGAVMRKKFVAQVVGGASYEFSPAVSLGFETLYEAEYPNFGARTASVFSAGPVINLQSRKVQVALGVLPQISGSPRTSGNLNLDDFERMQIRAIIGIEL
jgi:hypothetical protein